MPARSIGNANISFGLVSVPIRMFSAADTTSAIGFNLIHKDCGSRLKQKYICAKEGVEVSRDDMVKGYEFAKDQYVLFSPDELKAIEAKSDNQIEIVEFVPEDKVEPVYLDKLYYLGPDKGGDRAYRLLAAAMRETGLSALGRYNARGKQYLVLLTPQDGGLLMEQLRYADEVRTMEEVPLGNGEVKDSELQLAVQLIQQHASEVFEPQRGHCPSSAAWISEGSRVADTPRVGLVIDRQSGSAGFREARLEGERVRRRTEPIEQPQLRQGFLDGGHAADARLDALEQLLGDDALHVEGDRAAERPVHILRKEIENAADRGGGTGGVNRAEHEVAGLRRVNGRHERLLVPHFADEHHVGRGGTLAEHNPGGMPPEMTATAAGRRGPRPGGKLARRAWREQPARPLSGARQECRERP